MGLGFILGNASKDHQQKDFEQLAKWRKENPNRMVYYIVPNHIKFESEVNALKYMQNIFLQMKEYLRRMICRSFHLRVWLGIS